MKKSKLIAVFCCFYFSMALANAKMQISSPDFKDGQTIKEANVFNGFGCLGGNISPQINITNIPLNAKSLALTMYDPDAPTGSGWWHWIVYNIPTSTINISSGNKEINETPSFGQGAIVGRNDYGAFEYGGPCPPVSHGKHHYTLSVYALGIEKIDLPRDASAALIGYNINANLIEKASITSTYKR